MGERRIITKVELDTSQMPQGVNAAKATLTSLGNASTEMGRKAGQSVSNLEREYRRLVGAIDPADKAQQKYARAVQVTNELVNRGRLAQEQANETLRKAQTFYSAQAAAIHNLGDLLDKIGGKPAILAGQIFALAESFKAGWSMGEKLRGTLNELSDGGFDRAVQSALGMTALTEKFVGVANDAAGAAERLKNNLIILRRNGIDPVGLSAEEADKRVQALMRGFQRRGYIRDQADALFPKKEDVEAAAQIIHTAWEKVRTGTEEQQLNIARKGAALAQEWRKIPGQVGAAVDEFLLEMERVVKAHEDAAASARRLANDELKAARDRAEAAKRAAAHDNDAWERGWVSAYEDAAREEDRLRKESENARRKAAEDYVQNVVEMHQRAAQRTADIWRKAMDDIAQGIDPISKAIEGLSFAGLRLGKGGIAAEGWEAQLAALEAPTERLREIEAQFLDLMRTVGDGSVAVGEEAFRQLAGVLGITIEQLVSQTKEKLGDLSDLATIGQIRGAGDTPLQAYRAAQKEWERLLVVGAEHGLQIEKDIRAKQAEETKRFWDEQLGAWTGALDFLADAFGGFFSELQRLANAYQQGAQTGSAIGKALGGAEGAAAGGVAGGIVGIWVAAYEWFTNKTKQKQAESYGPAAVVSKQPGQDWEEYFSQLEAAQQRASRQIESTIEEFARVIGGVFTSFADIEIQVRRDGKYFHAFVQGVLIGSFTDMQSATEAAILAAFRDPETSLKGVSELVRQGFQEALARGIAGASLDELEQQLGNLREVSEITWTDAARQMSETVRHFDELWAALGRLQEATEASKQGMADLAAAEEDAWRARIRQFTGEKESPEAQLERLRREAALTKAQLQMRIADLKLRELELKEQLAMLQARGHIVGGGGALDQAEIQEKTEYLKARGKLLESEVDLYNAHIAAIQASLEAIDKLIAELEDIESHFDPNNVKLPRASGGRGGDQQGGLTQLIADSRRTVANEGKSSYALSIQEVNDRFDAAIKAEGLHANALEKAKKAHDEAIKAAHGNKEAIDKANAAYDRQVKHIKETEKQIDEANRARAAEIAMLQRQQHEATQLSQDQYVRGANPFADERDRAGALKDQWKELLDTGAIKWKEYKARIDELNRSLEAHIRTIGLQESATLFGNLAGLFDAAGLGESAEKEALLREQRKANFILTLAEAHARYAQLVAEGLLIGKNKDLVEGVLNQLDAFDPDKLFGNGASDTGKRFHGYDGEGAGSVGVGKTLDDANKLREKYQQSSDSLTKKLKEISDDFAVIFEKLGKSAENLGLFSEAVDDAFGDLKKPVQDWLASLGLSNESPLTGQQKLELAASQLDAIQARLQKGDFSAFQELAGSGSKFLELAAAQYGTAGADYERLYNRVKAMAQQDLSLADAAAATFKSSGQLGLGSVSAIPLTTQVVVDAIAKGNAAAQESAKTLKDIRRQLEDQTLVNAGLSSQFISLRASNESLARELKLYQNQRAS